MRNLSARNGWVVPTTRRLISTAWIRHARKALVQLDHGASRKRALSSKFDEGVNHIALGQDVLEAEWHIHAGLAKNPPAPGLPESSR